MPNSKRPFEKTLTSTDTSDIEEEGTSKQVPPPRREKRRRTTQQGSGTRKKRTLENPSSKPPKKTKRTHPKENLTQLMLKGVKETIYFSVNLQNPKLTLKTLRKKLSYISQRGTGNIHLSPASSLGNSSEEQMLISSLTEIARQKQLNNVYYKLKDSSASTLSSNAFYEWAKRFHSSASNLEQSTKKLLAYFHSENKTLPELIDSDDNIITVPYWNYNALHLATITNNFAFINNLRTKNPGPLKNFSKRTIPCYCIRQGMGKTRKLSAYY